MGGGWVVVSWCAVISVWVGWLAVATCIAHNSTLSPIPASNRELMIFFAGLLPANPAVSVSVMGVAFQVSSLGYMLPSALGSATATRVANRCASVEVDRGVEGPSGPRNTQNYTCTTLQQT